MEVSIPLFIRSSFPLKPNRVNGGKSLLIVSIPLFIRSSFPQCRPVSCGGHRLLVWCLNPFIHQVFFPTENTRFIISIFAFWSQSLYSSGLLSHLAREGQWSNHGYVSQSLYSSGLLSHVKSEPFLFLLLCVLAVGLNPFIHQVFFPT